MKPKKPAAPKRRKTAETAPLAAPPSPDDPEGLARYVMSLLEELGRQGTLEARRMRDAVVTVLEEYKAAADPAKAREEIKIKLLGLEVGAADLLVATTRKLRDRFGQVAGRAGQKSPQGKAAQVAVKGLTQLIDGLVKILDGVQVGSDELRQAGRAEVVAAQETLTSLSR